MIRNIELTFSENEMERPATPAEIVSRLKTANNAAKKLIKVPMNSNLTASHLKKTHKNISKT